MIMKNVLQEIKKHVKHGKYVLAVSGGRDSIALANACVELKSSDSGYEFLVVHVEHGLRDEESYRDAKFVEKFCSNRKLPFQVKHVNVLERVKKYGESIEEAARKLRYDILFAVANEYGANRVITAHHANDQAETVLLRLIRGAGSKGLGAMHIDNGSVLRPLLGCTREEIECYCKDNNLQWVDDSSNENVEFSRNFLRKEVFPLLKKLNSHVVNVLCQAAGHLQEDEDCLTGLANEYFDKMVKGNDLSVMEWEKIPLAIRKRVLRQWLLQFDCELSAVHIDAVDKMVLTGTSQKELALPGLTIRYAYHKLYVEKNKQHIRS